jgi:hypothetical protein
MPKHPVYNSVAATIYIVLVVLFINFIGGVEHSVYPLALPILVLSLLTLSVATMGYLFFYEPLMLFLAGKKEKALAYFIQTVIIFAGLTILIFSFFLTGVLL